MKRNNNKFPVEISGTSVEVSDNDPVLNHALRQFNRKVQDAGIIKSCKDRMHYEKPSSVRKRKKKAARKRWLKKQSKMMPTKN